MARKRTKKTPAGAPRNAPGDRSKATPTTASNGKTDRSASEPPSDSGTTRAPGIFTTEPPPSLQEADPEVDELDSAWGADEVEEPPEPQAAKPSATQPSPSHSDSEASKQADFPAPDAEKDRQSGRGSSLPPAKTVSVSGSEKPSAPPSDEPSAEPSRPSSQPARALKSQTRTKIWAPGEAGDESDSAPPAESSVSATRDVDFKSGGSKLALFIPAVLGVIAIVAVFSLSRTGDETKKTEALPAPTSEKNDTEGEAKPLGGTSDKTGATDPSRTKPVPSAAADADSEAKETKTVTLHLEPSGARAYYHGRSLGKPPIKIEIEPGERMALEVGKLGYGTRRVVIDGSEPEVSVGLIPRRSRKGAPKKTSKKTAAEPKLRNDPAGENDSAEKGAEQASSDGPL